MNNPKAILVIFALVTIGILGETTRGTVSAQDSQWTIQFGTPFADRANGVTTDRFGNLYVVGATNGKFPGQERSGGKIDAFLRKFDPGGTELWTRQFGSIGDDQALAVAVDSQGNILVAGEAGEDLPGKSRVSGRNGAYVRKYSPSGEGLWLRHFGVEHTSRATGVGVDQMGNVFIVGNTQGNLPGLEGSGNDDAFLRAYTSDGEELWSRQFGAEGGDFATSVAITALGEIYVVGWSRTKVQPVGSLELVLMSPLVRKFDGEGLEIWSRQVPIDGFARAIGAAVDAQGSLYMMGWVSGSLPGQSQLGRTDGFVRKYTVDGREAWTSQFGTDNEDRALGVGVDQAGNTYVAGWTKGVFPGQTGLGPKTFFVRQDAFVHKLDRAGSEVWTRQFGSEMPQSAVSVSAGPEGDMFVVGDTTGSLLGERYLGTIDAFMMKIPGDLPASLPELTPDTAAPNTAAVPLPEASQAPTSLPTSSPSGQPVTPPLSPDSSGGGCSAAPPGKVNSEWLVAALFLPGIVTARILSKGSRDRERQRSIIRPS